MAYAEQYTKISSPANPDELARLSSAYDLIYHLLLEKETDGLQGENPEQKPGESKQELSAR